MLLVKYTTIGTEEISQLSSILAKKEIPVIDQFQPIADFEELLTFSKAHPAPVVFYERHSAWQIESVASRIIEALAIAAHEKLEVSEWESLTQILLEHVEFLWTYPIAQTSREKLVAGSSLALAGCVCSMLPQSELWRIAGFGRIAANLSEVRPTSSDTHITIPIDAAFSLGSILNLQILDSAIDSYNKVLERKFTHNNIRTFPLNDSEFFRYLNLDYDGLADVKYAVMAGNYTQAKNRYTTFRNEYLSDYEVPNFLSDTNSFRSAKTYLACLLKLSIYPSPAISGTIEIGIAALLFPEFHISGQLFTLTLRRLKWITDTFFFRDGFHKEKLLSSQIDSINNFSRFIQVLDKVVNEHSDVRIVELRTLLEKQLNACIYLSKPDLSIPKWITTPICENLDTVELGNSKLSNISEFQYIHTLRKHGIEPSEKSYAFPCSGIYVMRDSWNPESQYLCFHNGPIGKQRYDNRLSFTLFAYGRVLITDGSGFADGTGMTSINTVLIDGKSQNQRQDVVFKKELDPDARWITERTFDFVAGEIQTEDFHHRRSIFHIRGEYYILHDVILGVGEHALEQIFHIGTSEKNSTFPYTLQENGQFWTEEKDYSNIFIASANIESLNVRIDGNNLAYRVQSVLPTVLNTVMYPMQPGMEDKITIKPVSVSADADVLASGFIVESEEKTDTFLISDDGYAKMSVSNSDMDIEFEGEYLLLRGNDFIMLNGRYLRVGSKVLADFSEPCEYYSKLT